MRLPPEPRAPGTDSRSSEASAGEQVERKGESPRQAEYRRWWQPVLDMRFDDPDQEPPKLFYPNNVRVALPWPGLTVTAYGMKDRCGVFLSGRDEALNEVWEKVTPHLDEIVAALPENTKVSEEGTVKKGISTGRMRSAFADEDAERAWLIKPLNAYVNALRPVLKG